MSHYVIGIVGVSTGIGRDVVPTLEAIGYTTRRFSRSPIDDLKWFKERNGKLDGVLFCQRYRGDGDDWDNELDVSLTTTKEAIDWIGANLRKVSVIVMASVAAVSVEEEQPVSYHACKAALVEIVKYYAVTLGPKQIRVNAIIPGLTIKPEARAFYDSHPELEALYKDITPLGRMGTVEDIAHLVDFLISDRSSYLTGQTIVLDGGISLRSPWALARRVSPNLRELNVTQRKAKP